MNTWLGWTLLALVSWGLWALVSKLMGDGLTGEQSQALSTLGFIPILGVLGVSRRAKVRGASRKGVALALIGGVTSCLGNIPYYAAVARGEKFATVISLAAMAPLVTVILALVLLREQLNRVQMVGLGLALIAIWLLNVADNAAVISPTVLVALLPILLWGFSGFCQKLATNHVNAETCALIYLGTFLPMGVYYGIREPWPVHLNTQTWLLAATLGFLLAFGNLAVLAAYAQGGKASVIAPLVNLFPVITIGLAILFLGESVTKREIAGILLALSSAAALSLETPLATTAP